MSNETVHDITTLPKKLPTKKIAFSVAVGLAAVVTLLVVNDKLKFPHGVTEVINETTDKVTNN